MTILVCPAMVTADDGGLLARPKTLEPAGSGWRPADSRRWRRAARGLRESQPAQRNERPVTEITDSQGLSLPVGIATVRRAGVGRNSTGADARTDSESFRSNGADDAGVVPTGFQTNWSGSAAAGGLASDQQEHRRVGRAHLSDSAATLPEASADLTATNVQTLPLEGTQDGAVDVSNSENGLLSISVHDAPLREVLSVLARSQGLNILTTDDVDARISGTFTDITFQDAMDAVFALTDATWTLQGNVILVTRLSAETTASPEAQGREVRVFTLNFVAAADVERVVSTLVSPSGQIAINESSNSDSSRTQEQVIVEDLPRYLQRVERYIREIDQPPRQVVIEAHILQVDLQNDAAHGVDFARIGEMAGVPISISTPGFNGTVTDLATFVKPSYSIALLDGSKSSAVIECLKKTTDAKTLASPKVMALNGQEASVQIGERLGYFVTTSTDTASLQSVEFLETGVVLKVTPRITADGRIMMVVKPEVSDGSVDALGLPSERTTEVSTTLMLADGMGMVVGGLIKETDVDNQQRLPFLGSLWGVGRLFRHEQVIRERSEIIIALVPHIVECSCPLDMNCELDRATTRLLQGPLEQMPRPWEPRLPDAGSNPRRLNGRRILDDATELEFPRRPLEYFPTADEDQYNTRRMTR